MFMRKKADDKISGGKKGRKRAGLLILGCAGGILLIYVGTACYFLNHFLLNTRINGHNFSGKTAAQAEAILESDIENYSLEITGNHELKEEIKGSDIDMEYKKDGQLKKIMKDQKAFLWPGMFFIRNRASVNPEFVYNDEKLQAEIDSLQAVTGEQIPSVSAYPGYDGDKFVIVPEEYGTQVNKERLNQTVRLKLEKLDSFLDLEKEKCYQEPLYTQESEEVGAACELMNSYSNASVVYTMDEDVVIDRSVISEWLSVDDKMQVTIDENAVKNWLEQFGDTYDTVGTTRSFMTPSGKAATVTGGTYGWSINEDTEFEAIINAIKNGENVRKEPAYYIGGTAASHTMPDWGNTYIDVDLSAQHMWYVENGNVALETDVVTGEPIPEKITPEGVYTILEKGLNQVLVGAIVPSTGKPEYRTTVSYWMRVTWSGIGFHDANWQSSFGGTRNQIPNVGSHGCINMPVDQAASLYNLIAVGTPVVIHY